MMAPLFANNDSTLNGSIFVKKRFHTEWNHFSQKMFPRGVESFLAKNDSILSGIIFAKHDSTLSGIVFRKK